MGFAQVEWDRRGRAFCYCDDACGGNYILANDFVVDLASLEIKVVGIGTPSGETGFLLLAESLEQTTDGMIRGEIQRGLVLPPQPLLFLTLHITNLSEYKLQRNRVGLIHMQSGNHLTSTSKKDSIV